MSASTKSLAAAGLAAALLVLPPARGGEADFQRIQDTIFTTHCVSCHSGLFAPHRLRLDVRNSYRSLVGMQSAEVPAFQRVKPGDPDASYLVQKIEGHASEGVRMPASGPPLSGQDIELIRQWIAGGAPAPGAQSIYLMSDQAATEPK
jgi:mono/diheme cytochrome c family protein